MPISECRHWFLLLPATATAISPSPLFSRTTYSVEGTGHFLLQVSWSPPEAGPLGMLDKGSEGADFSSTALRAVGPMRTAARQASDLEEDGALPSTSKSPPTPRGAPAFSENTPADAEVLALDRSLCHAKTLPPDLNFPPELLMWMPPPQH